VDLALTAGADIVTHVPIDRAIDESLVARMIEAATVSVPTLTMMAGTAQALARPGLDYANARESVAALHRAGVQVVAGTDANSSPGAPFSVPHGTSLHDELGLLVEAGLSPTGALRSATSGAAAAFGLSDRGVVEPGRRADLLLVDGPTSDIAAVRDIRDVWIDGVRTTRVP
jgi:imidazolonepropionase-like amidohydrolase